MNQRLFASRPRHEKRMPRTAVLAVALAAAALLGAGAAAAAPVKTPHVEAELVS